MKKRILSVVLAVTMATGLLTGCGPSNEVPERDYITVEGLKESFAKNLTLELTTDNIELIVWESILGPDQFIKEAGSWFTKLYPNIKIKYINVESTESHTKIGADGPAGNGPDLFATAHNNMGVMAKSLAVEPVPESQYDYMKANCSTEALLGATLNSSKGESKLYGYPVSVETYALFYNKAMISEADVPKTMADMVTYINNFKADPANKDKYAFLFDSKSAYYNVMFTSTPETHLYGPNGNDLTNTYQNTTQAVSQLQTDFLALSKAINMNAGDMKYKENDALFASGDLAMNISGAWNIKTFKGDGKINFGITSIPCLTGSENPPTNFMGVRCMFVSAYSKQKAEAEAFAEFLMTKEMQKLRCEITSTMPAREDVYADIEDPEVKGYMEGLKKQIAYSYPMPSMPEASLFWSAFEAAFANIWNGDAADIQSELDKANKTATKK